MVALTPLLLRGRAKHYDWGSPTAIPELIGRDPDGRPWAELWFGAHPAGPAEALVEGEWLPLDVLIEARPEALLGRACLERFGPRLPFLVKLLAAAQPLSLQVHPTAAQAVEGFAREEAAGTPLDAPTRTYRDPWHKPEVLCALGDFLALSGFRAAAAAAEVLDAFDLADVAARVRTDGLHAAFWWLWDQPPARRADLVARASSAAAAPPTGLVHEAALVARLVQQHPGDVGIVAALLLNLVRLVAGEALYAPAGRLHAYLEGFGVEVMATSDNVVRGGLTTKHVDLGELRRILDVRSEDVLPEREGPDGWPTPAPEFRLARLRPGQLAEVDGPEIVLCVHGPAEVAGLAVDRGGAAFVPAALDGYTVSAAQPVYRCRTGSLASG